MKRIDAGSDAGSDAAAEERAIKALSPCQRRTCALTIVDGLSHDEAGRLDGVSKWASMKRVQGARRRLRALGVEPPAFRQDTRRVRAWSLQRLENV